jgi:hypothetical protein
VPHPTRLHSTHPATKCRIPQQAVFGNSELPEDQRRDTTATLLSSITVLARYFIAEKTLPQADPTTLPPPPQIKFEHSGRILTSQWSLQYNGQLQLLVSSFIPSLLSATAYSIQSIAATLHICRPFLVPQPEDAPCRGDSTGPTCHSLITALKSMNLLVLFVWALEGFSRSTCL